MSEAIPVFPVSAVTQKVLHNFSEIAGQVILQEGQTQKVKGPGKSKTMFAIATLPEAWPKETAIYNFDTFLGVLSLFEKPAIQFNPDSMIITSDSRSPELKVKVRYADASTIESVASRSLPSDNPAVELTLSKNAIDRITKTAALLKLTHFSLIVEPERVVVMSADIKNPLSNVFELAVGDVTRHDPSFTRSMRFPIDHFQLLIDGDYRVALAGAWKYAFLTNQSLPVSYFIAEDRTGQATTRSATVAAPVATEEAAA